MSSGGGGQATSTTKTGPPAWLKPYQQEFIKSFGNLVFPGGSLASFPQGLNQQVAPFSQDQQNAFGLGESLTSGAQGLANLGAGENALFASGAFTGPNPFLNQYYNQAAQQDVQNYQQATQPALAAQAQQAGVFNSSGYNQAQSNAQYNLGQSLGTLGANIYEPAYQQGMTNQLAAAQGMPAAVQGLYGPTQNLYGLGSAQQQQQQNIFNAQYQNAAQQANWPFSILQQFGSALGLATAGGGVTTSTGPATSSK